MVKWYVLAPNGETVAGPFDTEEQVGVWLNTFAAKAMKARFGKLLVCWAKSEEDCGLKQIATWDDKVPEEIIKLQSEGELILVREGSKITAWR